MEKIINSQQELDKIKLDFIGDIIITGGDLDNPIKLSKSYQYAYVILRDNAVINMYNNSYVNVMYDNSYVNYMRDNSCVNQMYGNSCVKNMYDYSYVNWMYKNSYVNEMRDDSHINEMLGNSYVKDMYENSCVKDMYENSCVKKMFDNAKATVYGDKVNINCLGKNVVFVPKYINDLSNIKLNDSSQIIHDTFETNQSIDFYLKNYDIKKKDDNTLIMYKAVHKSKVDGEYFSNYDVNFIYKIGQTLEHECSKNINKSCSKGLHVSDLAFAKRFGSWWEDLAIIECEVSVSDIVISKDCDGKVRTSRLTVIKEIN